VDCTAGGYQLGRGQSENGEVARNALHLVPGGAPQNRGVLCPLELIGEPWHDKRIREQTNVG